MPKVGMEPVRREALIRAAIAEIGAVGSLDVTVGRIARRAGVSAALAHHYFGSKDRILVAGMRRILEEFGKSVRARYREARSPKERVRAIVEASFEPSQFDPAIVSAWLAFYTEAQRSAEASRLLKVYARRLESNLIHALRTMLPDAEARRTARGIGSLIDGLYIRAALQTSGTRNEDAIALVLDYLDLCLTRERPA